MLGFPRRGEARKQASRLSEMSGTSLKLGLAQGEQPAM